MKKNRLIEIIQEEIEEIIISEEYQDDEIIDFDKISLQQEFNKVNAELFDNKVPVVPLKWSRRKTALGHVKNQVIKQTMTLLSMELWMSTFFSVTYKQFRDVMAHEMIHVLINDRDTRNVYDPHGWQFMREAERINGMGLGFNITKTNGEDLALSNKTLQRTAGKTRTAIIFDMDGKFNIAVTTRQVYERDFETLIRILENAVNKGRRFNRIELNVVESDNPELMKYKQQRNFVGNVGFAPISDELLEDLLNGDIIKTVTLEKGQERMIAEYIQ